VGHLIVCDVCVYKKTFLKTQNIYKKKDLQAYFLLRINRENYKLQTYNKSKLTVHSDMKMTFFK